MWGPGLIIHVINILPFAFFIFGPFLYRRSSLLGMHPYGNRRTYYRQWWVKMFFGKSQVTVYTSACLFFFARYFVSGKQDNEQYHQFIGFTHKLGDYDEEVNVGAHKMIVKEMYVDMAHSTRDSIFAHRAQRDHDLKTIAFNKYAEEILGNNKI